MKSNGPWFACTYRILHVRCLLLKAWGRGWWWWWWWLVGVYVLPHWHQTVLWYGNGRAKEEWLLTKALFGYRPRSIPPSFHPSFSIPLCSLQLPSFWYLLTSPRFTCTRSQFLLSLFVDSKFRLSLNFLSLIPFSHIVLLCYEPL